MFELPKANGAYPHPKQWRMLQTNKENDGWFLLTAGQILSDKNPARDTLRVEYI